MLTATLISLFERDLNKLISEIKLYQKEENIWRVEKKYCEFSRKFNATFNWKFKYLLFSEKTTTVYLLVHLTTHLAYHLGQINYHRRLIEG